MSGSQLNTDDVNDLLEFDNIGRTYCAPTNRRPFTMTISYSSPVLLTEIGIHGYDGLLNVNDFVTEFSLSFSEGGSNFTDYIQGVKSTPTVCFVRVISIMDYVAIFYVFRFFICHVMRGITLYCVLPSLPLV